MELGELEKQLKEMKLDGSFIGSRLSIPVMGTYGAVSQVYISHKMVERLGPAKALMIGSYTAGRNSMKRDLKSLMETEKGE